MIQFMAFSMSAWTRPEERPFGSIWTAKTFGSRRTEQDGHTLLGSAPRWLCTAKTNPAITSIALMTGRIVRHLVVWFLSNWLMISSPGSRTISAAFTRLARRVTRPAVVRLDPEDANQNLSARFNGLCRGGFRRNAKAVDMKHAEAR